MSSPIVSVLMTAYNRENFIAESIESVLNSSFQDFELIIVDDNSNDNTVQIANAYKEKDKRVRVFVNEKNLGDYFNRNKAAEYARGKYLKYVDSDDLIEQSGLEKMVKGMEMDYLAGLGVCDKTKQSGYPFAFSPVEVYERHFFENGMLYCGPSGVIIRHSVFKEFGGFSGKRMVGDTELWLKIAGKYKVMVFEPSLIFWRVHEGQEFRIGIESSLYLQMNLPVIEQSLLTPRCPLNEKQIKAILKRERKSTARQILSLALKKRKFRDAFFIYSKLKLPWHYFLRIST